LNEIWVKIKAVDRLQTWHGIWKYYKCLFLLSVRPHLSQEKWHIIQLSSLSSRTSSSAVAERPRDVLSSCPLADLSKSVPMVRPIWPVSYWTRPWWLHFCCLHSFNDNGRSRCFISKTGREMLPWQLSRELHCTKGHRSRYHTALSWPHNCNKLKIKPK